MSMTLVEARVGLTNYYHNQVIRNHHLDIDSTIIDDLSSQNHDGGISPSSLLRAAVHSGGLNAQASGYASIQGGWNESKGLMMLKFLATDSPVALEYLYVIGYITNNQSMEGLHPSAMFHPAMSWKIAETITSSMNIGNPTNIKRQIGARTDYLFNDGSNQFGAGITLRPTDVIDYSIEKASHDNILERMEEEGLEHHTPTTTVAASDISRVGVIASKRQNINPAKYAQDILEAGTNYQRSNLISTNSMDIGGTQSQYDGMFGELANLAYEASGKEPQILRDEFFQSMMLMLGQSGLRGFVGYSIGDLVMAFDNLNDVLDLTLMDASEFTCDDYTLTTEALGTSNLAEFISDEIKSNILDLMMKHDLAGISFRGSNCDNFGDGALDNIVILAYAPASLKDDDLHLGSKVELFINELRSQIFAKLNGIRANQLTPLRFDVTAELFGTCTINTQIVTPENHSTGFDVADTGVPTGMNSRSFPTFAGNQTSSILGDNESAQIAGGNFFSNLEAYFQ